MSYIDKTLVGGEKVLCRGRLHWIMFFIPAILLAAAVAAFVGMHYQSWLVYPGGLLLAAALATGISSFIAWHASEFAVTNKRVIVKTGFLRSHSVEIVLGKVEGITIDQDMFGNLFNYGTIRITGTGGTQERFERIADPYEFRRRIQ